MQQEQLEIIIRNCIQSSSNRDFFWQSFINQLKIKSVLEVGVFRGQFAENLLVSCPCIESYYMIDPWRRLENWDKPYNKSDEFFRSCLAETEERTAFARDKTQFLRGTTAEKIDEISDGSLDFAYIDGDHTLRGITNDLVRVYPKVREGGWIGGDDFINTIWHHRPKYEPTFVFPFAVYFAESTNNNIYALPHSQFLICKKWMPLSSFTDYSYSKYSDTSMKKQLGLTRLLYANLRHQYKIAVNIPRKILRRVAKGKIDSS